MRSLPGVGPIVQIRTKKPGAIGERETFSGPAPWSRRRRRQGLVVTLFRIHLPWLWGKGFVLMTGTVADATRASTSGRRLPGRMGYRFGRVIRGR
jgi:hypothetical protein